MAATAQLQSHLFGGFLLLVKVKGNAGSGCGKRDRNRSTNAAIASGH
jgi:hypothetical protein